jgi:hypothetical protein
MKNLFLSLIFALVAVISLTQPILIPGTKYPFYSDIIKFTDGDVNGLPAWEIVSLNKHIKWNPSPVPLNEKLVQQNLLKSLNAFRKQYGKKPLKLSSEISNDLKYSVETNSSIIDTWGCYGYYNEFNIVQQFENREEKFCDYQFDVMSIGSELFFTMINSKATVVGFYYKQNKQESTYIFKVYIK